MSVWESLYRSHIRDYEYVLHNFSEAHGLIYARNCKSQVLHHRSHNAILISCRIIRSSRSKSAPVRTLLDKFLQRARGIDLHGKEVVEAIDFGRVLAKFLTKGIREIVCRVSGLLRGQRSQRVIVPMLTMSSTDSRQEASWIAREHDVVVLPRQL